MSVYSPANGAYRQTAGNTIISSGQWYHFAGVMDPVNNQIAVYVNGQSDNSSPTSWVDSDRMESATSSYGYFDMGAQTYSSEGPSKYWDGKIDSARIYNRVLNANEILAIYNAGG